MSANAAASRISWLSASLSTQKHRIMTLLGRVGDLGVMQAMKPLLFHKFLNLMGQIAAAKDEEMHILSAIEAIEQKHRFDRKEGKLKHPKKKPEGLLAYNKEGDTKEYDEEYEEYCRKYRLRDQGIEPVNENEKEFLAYDDWQTYRSRENDREREDENENEFLNYQNVVKPARPKYGWLWLLAFWFLMSSNASPKRNQSLNAD